MRVLLQISVALALGMAIVAGAPAAQAFGPFYPADTIYPADNLYPAAE